MLVDSLLIRRDDAVSDHAVMKCASGLAAQDWPPYESTQDSMASRGIPIEIEALKAGFA